MEAKKREGTDQLCQGKREMPRRDSNTEKGNLTRIVAKVQALFPKFDFPLLSKAMRPDLYGIELVEEAKLLAGIPLKKRRRSQKRKETEICTFHCTKALKMRLQIQIDRLGLGTMQNCMELCVNDWLERKES